MTTPTPSETSKPKTLPKGALKSWAVALTILAAYAGLAIFAATRMSEMEEQKKGFQAIEVTQPISGIDETYLKKASTKD